MALNPLIIETDYFTNIQNRRGLMKAADFDFQFNNIVNYINSSVISLLNTLTSGTTPGSQDPNKVNTYLKNVGDTTTEWSNIISDNIPDYSLSFIQLAQANPCSVIGTGTDQILRPISSLEDRQSLISQNNDIPVWNKITAANIEDRQITDIKIALATLLNNNFQQGVLDIQLLNDSVTTEKIANNTIPSGKIADEAINEMILDGLINQFCGRNGSKVFLWGNVLPDNFINNNKLIATYQPSGTPVAELPYTIDYTKLSPGFQIQALNYRGGQGSDTFAFQPTDIADKAIEGYQIVDGSLAGGRLFQYGYSLRQIDSMLEDDSIEIDNLPADYRAKLGL
jgi:hypothetical protein